MRVTRELIVEWGATCGAVPRFEADYPDGLDLPVREIAEIPMLREGVYWRLWFLHEVAARVEGPEGDDALALLVESADASRLAKAVNEIRIRDTAAALDRLCAMGDGAALFEVAKRAPAGAGGVAALRLASVMPAEERDWVMKALPVPRAEVFGRACGGMNAGTEPRVPREPRGPSEEG